MVQLLWFMLLNYVYFLYVHYLCSLNPFHLIFILLLLMPMDLLAKIEHAIIFILCNLVSTRLSIKIVEDKVSKLKWCFLHLTHVNLYCIEILINLKKSVDTD